VPRVAASRGVIEELSSDRSGFGAARGDSREFHTLKIDVPGSAVGRGISYLVVRDTLTAESGKGGRRGGGELVSVELALAAGVL
jgi:hypothetical protein